MMQKPYKNPSGVITGLLAKAGVEVAEFLFHKSDSDCWESLSKPRPPKFDEFLHFHAKIGGSHFPLKRISILIHQYKDHL